MHFRTVAAQEMSGPSNNKPRARQQQQQQQETAAGDANDADGGWTTVTKPVRAAGKSTVATLSSTGVGVGAGAGAASSAATKAPASSQTASGLKPGSGFRLTASSMCSNKTGGPKGTPCTYKAKVLDDLYRGTEADEGLCGSCFFRKYAHECWAGSCDELTLGDYCGQHIGALKSKQLSKCNKCKCLHTNLGKGRCTPCFEAGKPERVPCATNDQFDDFGNALKCGETVSASGQGNGFCRFCNNAYFERLRAQRAEAREHHLLFWDCYSCGRTRNSKIDDTACRECGHVPNFGSKKAAVPGKESNRSSPAPAAGAGVGAAAASGESSVVPQEPLVVRCKRCTAPVMGKTQYCKLHGTVPKKSRA